MNEADAININALYGIRTDAIGFGPKWRQCIQRPESNVKNPKDGHLNECNEELVSSAAANTEFATDRLQSGLHLRTKFVYLPYPTKINHEKSVKYYTICPYPDSIAQSEVDIVIDVCDVIESNFCIGFRDGNKLFEKIIEFISLGKHVVVSFENVKSLSAAFLESSIGQLYKCDIPEVKLRECITWKCGIPTRELLIQRAISEAKKSKATSRREPYPWIEI